MRKLAQMVVAKSHFLLHMQKTILGPDARMLQRTQKCSPLYNNRRSSPPRAPNSVTFPKMPEKGVDPQHLHKIENPTPSKNKGTILSQGIVPQQ